LPPTSPQTKDPIFDAIERHRRAMADCNAKVGELTEREADGDRKAARAVNRLHNAIDKSEEGLIDVVPMTIAGVSALLNYAAEVRRRGDQWHTGYVLEDEPISRWEKQHGVPFDVVLHKNTAAAPPKIVA
jgi:hypothetical protein